MELDQAFAFAVILAWEDFSKFTDPRSARVEYRSAPGTSVDYLAIWSVDSEGHQKMLCDYWTWTSPLHSAGICFKGQFRSPQLGQALDFILMNQHQFTRPADACPQGLALIYPPTGVDLIEATTWMSAVHGAATHVSRAESESSAAL